MGNADLLEIGEPLNEESKFSLVIVGGCPHCGAPIWAKKPSELAKNPPENIFTCKCKELVIKKLENEANPPVSVTQMGIPFPDSRWYRGGRGHGPFDYYVSDNTSTPSPPITRTTINSEDISLNSFASTNLRINPDLVMFRNPHGVFEIESDADWENGLFPF